jgi:hypothetical protein
MYLTASLLCVLRVELVARFRDRSRTSFASSLLDLTGSDFLFAHIEKRLGVCIRVVIFLAWARLWFGYGELEYPVVALNKLDVGLGHLCDQTLFAQLVMSVCRNSASDYAQHFDCIVYLFSGSVGIRFRKFPIQYALFNFSWCGDFLSIYDCSARIEGE